MPGSRRRNPRLAGLLALVLAAGLVLALVAVLVLRTREQQQAAAAEQFVQVTQTPQAVAVPTAAFIGDSYSAGTGSTGYDARFTTLVATYEGWSSESFAYGGTGYLRETTTNGKAGCGADCCPSYEKVLTKVKAYDPTIVFVSGGRNDVGLPQAQVARAITRFYEDLRAALPNARIITTSPVWAYEKPPAQIAQIRAAVQQAVASVGGTYLDIGEPLVDDRSLVGPDHVHPNNRGHAAIAQAAEVTLSAAESPSASPAPTAS